VGDVQGKVLPTYEVTDLGFLDCGLGLLCDSSEAISIGETESNVGLVEVPDPHCNDAGLFRNGEWRDLGALGTTPGGTSQSEAHDVNGRGQVVGSSNTSDPPPPNCCIVRHAFIWDEEEGMRDLGTLGSFTQCFGSDGEQICITSNFSDAVAINDFGQVVGNTSSSEAQSTRPFIWDKKSGMRDLGVPDFSDPVDINNRGQIAGNTRNGRRYLGSEGNTRPWLPR
jgi:probable HAF family extracellular repeat protein